MFYVYNDSTGQFAANDSKGQHDGKTVSSPINAKSFFTRGEASEYSQNFGPDWRVTNGED